MKSIIICLLVAVSLSSCVNYGKKVNIEGTKGEVVYKGEGITEDQAKKLGEYLKNANYFSAEKRMTVQLTNAKDGGYDIRFAMDEKKANEIPGLADEFMKLGAALSIDQFNNKPVNIFFTDAQYKEFKSIPFNNEMVKKLLEPGSGEETNHPAESDGNAEPADSTSHSNQ